MLNLQNIRAAKRSLLECNAETFIDKNKSFRFFLNKIKVNDFRHIRNLTFSFDHPVTVISGTNKIGKTSILLLIACSHENFKRYDSTAPDTAFRRHTWKDVLNFTSYESATRNYSYELFWRVGIANHQGEGKRAANKQAWTGLGKLSKDQNRINAQIRDKEVRLIDLERILPARNFSNSLLRKTSGSSQNRLHEDIEKAFNYILETVVPVEIYKIGSHINKVAYLISPTTQSDGNDPYSSYNAASGEESLINILVDVIDSPCDSLILIDEIEAGLHPYIQRRIADVIQYISWHHKKQFVVTTHSPSLLSAFPKKSRKFIDLDVQRNYQAISAISVNAAFSKMDSKAYPLINLYCEDSMAKFIIKSICITINGTIKFFDRLLNIIESGPADQVRNDYERHKRNYPQLKLKVGYCCVFDGDYKDDPKYSSYHNDPNNFSFFLYPYSAPEKFLVKAYLLSCPNVTLSTALTHSDHHALFQEMVNLGLAPDVNQAINLCWQSFLLTPEYNVLFMELRRFLIKAVTHFSDEED